MMLQLVAGGTAGSEALTRNGNALTLAIADGVSTQTQICTALTAGNDFASATPDSGGAAWVLGAQQDDVEFAPPAPVARVWKSVPGVAGDLEYAPIIHVADGTAFTVGDVVTSPGVDVDGEPATAEGEIFFKSGDDLYLYKWNEVAFAVGEVVSVGGSPVDEVLASATELWTVSHLYSQSGGDFAVDDEVTDGTTTAIVRKVEGSAWPYSVRPYGSYAPTEEVRRIEDNIYYADYVYAVASDISPDLVRQLIYNYLHPAGFFFFLTFTDYAYGVGDVTDTPWPTLRWWKGLSSLSWDGTRPTYGALPCAIPLTSLLWTDALVWTRSAQASFLDLYPIAHLNSPYLAFIDVWDVEIAQPHLDLEDIAGLTIADFDRTDQYYYKKAAVVAKAIA
jgi:hypothetical protein